MSTIRQQPDSVERGPLWVSAIVVIGAILASVLTVWSFTMQARGSISAWPGAAQGFLSTPEDVSAIELHPFTRPTAAERQRESARAQLAGYGWVDRPRGLVRIPVEVAARLYLRERTARGGP